jgi:type IV pilus assembly protein PilC
MAVFEYEVVDQKGTMGRGRAEADDQSDLVQRFRERGQLVLSIRPAGGSVSVGMPTAASFKPLGDALRQSLRRVSTGVSLSTLVLFTGQLAAMLDAGIHLVRILTSLARESTNKRFQEIVDDIRASVTAGATFAEALNQHPTVFNRLYVAVVRAGEQSGSLPIVLNTLTTYLEKADALRRKVKGAIAYPAVILVTAILIVFAMIIKIVPVFQEVYTRARAQLPAPTRLLILVSDVMRNYTLLAIVSLAVAGVLFYMALQSERGRLGFDIFKLRMPIFGTLIRKAIMARVCRTMGLLLQSGIPLIDAMETVSQVSGNLLIENAMKVATQRVRDGETLAETLRQSGQFPGMVTQLVASGEESGTLPAMLGKAALYYEQQVDNSVATLSTLIEPIMIVIVGAIAGGVILALYLPIFSLGQAIKGGMR